MRLSGLSLLHPCSRPAFQGYIPSFVISIMAEAISYKSIMAEAISYKKLIAREGRDVSRHVSASEVVVCIHALQTK